MFKNNKKPESRKKKYFPNELIVCIFEFLPKGELYTIYKNSGENDRLRKILDEPYFKKKIRSFLFFAKKDVFNAALHKADTQGYFFIYFFNVVHLGVTFMPSLAFDGFLSLDLSNNLRCVRTNGTDVKDYVPICKKYYFNSTHSLYKCCKIMIPIDKILLSFSVIWGLLSCMSAMTVTCCLLLRRYLANRKYRKTINFQNSLNHKINDGGSDVSFEDITDDEVITNPEDYEELTSDEESDEIVEQRQLGLMRRCSIL